MRFYGRTRFCIGRAWRKQLARASDRPTQARARRLKEPLQRFEVVLGRGGPIRDYLAAKRQPLAASRADDMEATALMWLAVNASVVNDLGVAAIGIYDGLAQSAPGDSIINTIALPFATQARVRAALPTRAPYWYLAADTGADFRPHTLPAAQGGELGRMIAQINDVALHLDTLRCLAPVVYSFLPYDWLVRSALLVELAALLDLTVGSPGTARQRRPSLLEICSFGRVRPVGADLVRLRDSISYETRVSIRWCRDKLGAHLDQELPLVHLHQHLVLLDYQGMIVVAEHVLDWLDQISATQLDLKLLVIGERRIGSWPLNRPIEVGLKPPDPSTIPGSLAGLFRSIDSPYMTGTASSIGSAIVAGISAGRKPRPRDKVRLPPRESKYLDRCYRCDRATATRAERRMIAVWG